MLWKHEKIKQDENEDTMKVQKKNFQIRSDTKLKFYELEVMYYIY